MSKEISESAATVLETAYVFRAKVAGDDLSVDDRRALEEWLRADEEHRRAFERTDLAWRRLAHLSEDHFVESGERVPSSVEPVAQDAPPPPAPSFFGGFFGPRFGLATALAGALLAAIFFAPAAAPPPPPREAVPETVHHRSPVAELRSVTLSDGTVATLGAESEIAVCFGGASRAVELVAGDVYFDVATDSDRPFTASADGLTARVVGTRFSLRRGATGVRLAVAEGWVAAVPEAPAGEGAVEPELLVGAGQGVSFPRGGGLSPVYQIPPEDVAAWRRHELIYAGAALADVAADADRYYSGKITVDDDAGALTLHAAFDGGDIEGLLAAVEEALPVRVERRGDGSIHLRKEPGR
ncbi:MAG: FecR domain-containing protein [Acidobacteriota bacterium]